MILVRASTALHFLVLGVWVGGLVALGPIVPRLAFAVNPEFAGVLVGSSLRLFGKVEIACAVVALFTAVICQFVGVWGPRVRWPRLLAIVAMAALTLVYTQSVYPAMEELQPRRASDPAAKAEFQRLHSRSTALVGANLLLGAAVLAVSAATMRSPEGS